MDLGSNSTVKTPDAETETPTRMLPGKAFTNGVLKRHVQTQTVVTYKECLKNHAASLGGHAVDGCGEFMPAPNSNPAEPTSLKCAACGCHRNFHRRDPDDLPPNEIPALEYHPLHRHHPPPPLPRGNISGSPMNSPSPPPISSSYYPHTLLALSHGLSGPSPENSTPISVSGNAATAGLFSSASRKRFRTKFTQYQKEKMLELAEKVCWKMQKKDEVLINESCSDIGVDKVVFKVWMHNNKNTFGKKESHQLEQPPLPPPNNGATHSATPPPYSNGEIKLNQEISQYDLHHHITKTQVLGTNGTSSSS